MANTTTMSVTLPASANDWTSDRRLGFYEGQLHTLNGLVAIERGLMRSGGTAANPQGMNPSRRRRAHRKTGSTKTAAAPR